VSQVPDAAARWVSFPTRLPDAAVRLFCLPHAGGGATVFQSWPAALAGIEIAAIRLPGREGRFREAPIERVDPLVEAIAAGIAPPLDRPYALYGHSVGALIAFELARRLRRDGLRQPDRLIVAGCDAPHRQHGEPLFELPDEQFVARLRALGGMSAELLELPELIELLLPQLRADVALGDTYVYRPGPPLDSPIRAFYGDRDEATSPELVAAWEDQTSAGFVMRALPGGHFFPQAERERLLAEIHRDVAALGADPIADPRHD